VSTNLTPVIFIQVA